MRHNWINEVRKMGFKMPREAAVTMVDENFSRAEVAQVIYDLCMMKSTKTDQESLGWQKASAIIGALKDLEE